MGAIDRLQVPTMSDARRAVKSEEEGFRTNWVRESPPEIQFAHRERRATDSTSASLYPLFVAWLLFLLQRQKEAIKYVRLIVIVVIYRFVKYYIACYIRYYKTCNIFLMHAKNSKKIWYIDSYTFVCVVSVGSICEISWNSSLLFSRELASHQCEEKSQMRIVFEKFVEREGQGRNALEAPENFYVRHIWLQDLQGSLVSLSDIGPEKFRPYSILNSLAKPPARDGCLLELWKLMHKCDKRKVVLLYRVHWSN